MWFISTDIIPHLQPNDGDDEQAVRKMMNQWRFETKPHIVADSDFGSWFWQEISELGEVIQLCQFLSLRLHLIH